LTAAWKTRGPSPVVEVTWPKVLELVVAVGVLK
jgi:hypothetical protein